MAHGRQKAGSYLAVSQKILYGKWKNHLGRIVSFGADKWGNPTITIEPIPRGRKKLKTLGLFKVWRADVVEKAKAQAEAKEQALAQVTVAAPGRVQQQGQAQVQAGGAPLVLTPIALRVAARYQRAFGVGQ